MKKIFIFSLLIISFIFPFNLHANPIKQKNNKLKEPQYLNLDSKKLFERNKSTDDYLELYNYLSKFKPLELRGEFETKEEYKKRLAKAKNEDDENTKQYVFYVKASFPSFKYNNDDLFYTVSVSYKNYKKNVKFVQSLIYEKIEDVGSYIIYNALGEDLKINKSNRKDYYINIFDVDTHSSRDYCSSYEFIFKVDPQKAQDLKSNMSLIYEVIAYNPKYSITEEDKYNDIAPATAFKNIYSDMNTFVFKNYENYKPTVSLTNDVATEELGINTKAINIYLIDNRNNEILAKF